MRRTVPVVASLLFFSCAHAQPTGYGTPVQSVAAFEQSMRQCLLDTSNRTTCLNALVSRHLPVDAKVIEGIVSLLRQWMGTDQVRAVHLVRSAEHGDVVFRRQYLIEDTTGQFMLLDTVFLRRLGQIHLHRFSLSSKKESVERALDLTD